MSDPLYRKELLRLAADATGAGRLTQPCGTGRAFNPACGDRVTVDIVLENNRVAGIAHDTHACILTQDSAAILGGDLVGLGRDEVEALKQSVECMLQGAEPPAAPFDSFASFDGLADHKARHRCVLLPFEAVLAAFDASEASEPS